MARLYIPLSAALLFMTFLSCGSGKNEKVNEVSTDSLERADSLEKMESQWTIDSAKMVRMSTPDLEFCELHGPVKSIKYNDGLKYEFSRDGKLLLVDNYCPFYDHSGSEDDYGKMSLKRNSKGEINSYVMWESSEDYEWKNGKISKIEGGGEGLEWHITMSYDENGQLRAKKGYQQMEDGTEHEDIDVQFTYLDTDKYGNWTKRKAGKVTETRTITYFNIVRPAADEFCPILKTYDFNGKIGTEKDCPMQIGPDGGYYVVGSGKKVLRFSDYDPAKGDLTIDAFKPDGERYIGRFNGKLSGKTYKGTFTNHKGGKVTFEFTLK